MHSPNGGLFQPTMTEAIRLFAKGGFHAPSGLSSSDKVSLSSPDLSDPFSSAQLTYTTTGSDSILAPSAYTCNSYGWIHIHPEGMVHQSKHNTMRYFKWGVARLILEPPECPDVVPMFIEGTDQIMPANREYPKFIPRAGKNLAVTFGEKVDTEKVFGDLRTKWSKLKAKAGVGKSPLGELNEELMHGTEAVELRKECTRRVRAEVIKVRKSRGFSNEDPKEGLVETWRREGPRREGQMKDGTWVEQR